MAEQQKNPNRDIERETTPPQPGREESGQRRGTEEGRTGGTRGPTREGQRELEEVE